MRHLRITVAVIQVWCLCCGSGRDGDETVDLVGRAGPSDIPGTTAAPTAAPGEKKTTPDLLTIDLIEDLVFRYERDAWTLTTPGAHVTLDALRRGGVDYLLSALPLAPGVSPTAALDRALSSMDALVKDAGGELTVVSGIAAAREAMRSGRIPVGLLMEGADALEGRLDRIPELKKRGLTVVGILGGKSNAFADAAAAPRKDGGLTAKGEALLTALKDAGIAVDVTHASSDTFWDVLVRTAGKTMVTHTAVRALMDHPRNLDDLQILALARYGGVMGLLFNPDFLKVPPGDALEDVVVHIMHVKALGAITALALGTDYGGIHPPRGLEDVSRLPRLADALRAQGLSDEEVAGVFGETVARFFDEMARPFGEVTLTEEHILRPVAADCESVIGTFEGTLSGSCDGLLLNPGVLISPASKLKVRIRNMSMIPAKLEIFGEPGVLWQAEGQNLDGKILFHHLVQLDGEGTGTVSLPQNRNLTRMFFSPTRTSSLREVVVWGREPLPERLPD